MSKSFGLLGLLLAASIIMMAGIAALATYTPALVGDTYMDANEENETFADEETLWVTSLDGEPTRISFLTFDEIVKLAREIESGELRMNVTEVESSGEVSLHFYDMPVLETWSWADLPEYEEDALATLEIEETGWVSWNATSLVQMAATECSEGCPFTIVLVAEGDTSIGFTSMEGSNDKKAVLEYSH